MTILYAENPKDSTKNFKNKQIQQNCGMQNTKNQLHFKFTNNKQFKKEFEKRIPCTTVSRRIKLTRKAKDMHTENYKKLLKDIIDKQWKDIPYSWI